MSILPIILKKKRWLLGALLNLNALKSRMDFWADSFDFTTSKLTDKSGNTANEPALVDSYCLDFNGTSAYVSFLNSNFPSVDGLIITAQPNGGSWTDYTELTAPTGLYSIVSNILYIGKDGANFFNGKIARIILKDGETILFDIPLSNGYGTNIYYTTPSITLGLHPDLENGTLLDTDTYSAIDGWPDTLGIPTTNWTSVTKQMINTPVNGWSGRHCRVDFVTKGSGTYFFSQKTYTAPSPLLSGGYIKIRYRTNIIGANFATLYCGSWAATQGKQVYVAAAAANTIEEQVFYVPGSDMAGFTFYITNAAEGSYVEFDYLAIGMYALGSGTIVNATWSATCPVYHANLKLGCNIYVDSSNNLIYCPLYPGGLDYYVGSFLLYKSISAATNYLTEVETKLQFPDIAALKTNDTKNYLYDVGGTANKLGYTDLVGAKGDYFFSNVYTPDSGINNIILMKTSVSGSILKTIIRELKYEDKRLYIDFTESVPTILRKLNNSKYIYQIGAFGDVYMLDGDYETITKPTTSLIKNNYDDDCPALINGSYQGGNHGYYGLMEVTLVGHDKTSLDVGSIWATGDYNYKLVSIAGNVLSFIQNGIAFSGVYNYKKTFTSGTLTHVSGAAHTGSIDATSTERIQLTPAVSTLTAVFIDGVQVSQGFEGYCNEMELKYTEDIYDFVNIEDYYPDNMINCPFNVHRYKNYIFAADCSIRTKEIFTALDDDIYISGYDGIEQAGPLNKSLSGITKLLYYIPGSIPFTIGGNNWDFRSLTDLFTITPDETYFDSAKREEGKHINRLVEILASNTESLYGFSHGYFERNSDVNNSGIDWFLYTTKKSYPYYASDLAVLKDTSISGEAFRTYFDALRDDNAMCSYIVKTDTGYRLYIDVHTNLSEQWITVPSEIVGMNITVDDNNANITIHSTQVKSDGVQISVTNNYGYAVLKLT